MTDAIDWFLKDNYWIRMILIDFPTQIFCIKMMEMLLGKKNKTRYLLVFMVIRTTLLCFLQSMGDQISRTGRVTEVIGGALGSIIAVLIAIYVFEEESVKILFAMMISEFVAMFTMTFSIVILNWLEKRPEGIFGWFLIFRPEDLLAWVFELFFFILFYGVIKKFKNLFQAYEIRHKYLIWVVYLGYFLIMQTSQIVKVTGEQARLGFVIPFLIVGACAFIGICKIFSAENKKVRTESQFLQMELSMMQSQYQAIQYQRIHIEENRKLIDRQMQEIMQKSERSEKQEQVAGYLADLENTYQNIHAGIYCKDWTLDAILYTEIERAWQQGISVTCKVQNYPKDQDGIQCMGKVLVTLFEYAITESKKTKKTDGSKKPQIAVQIDVIANQAVVLFTCQAENGTRALKKKLDELTKEREGNTEIEKKDRICVGTVFAGDGVFRHC